MGDSTVQDVPKDYQYVSIAEFKAHTVALAEMMHATLSTLRPPLLVIACVLVDVIKSIPELEKMTRDLLAGRPLDYVLDENVVKVPKAQAEA